MDKKVLILVNHDVVIYNFRRELVERLLHDGHKVYISSPYGERIDDLVAMGCKYTEVSISRHGTNILEELNLLSYYIRIIKKIRPDVVLSYTIKPNIYGGLVCRIKNIPFFPNVTGLGTAVENSGLLQKLILLFYKVALRKANCVFFQNTSNQQYFVGNHISTSRNKFIPGSGVNLDAHCYEEYPNDDGIVRFLFMGRIMKDKGIEELIEAASIIKKKYNHVYFDLIGFVEKEYEKKAVELEKLGFISFHGFKRNVHGYIKKCHAVVLPSYHEGMANVLLEAASTGRPVLASNIPGCKETFDEDISGFGFKPKDVDSLVDTLIKFIELPYEKKKSMGLAGRKKMEQEFDRMDVVNIYMEEINKAIYKRG